MIGISIVTLAELRYGAAYSTHPDSNNSAIDAFVDGIVVLGFDPEAARIFGDIKADLRRAGTLIEDLDLIIAATALARDLTLVTNNTDHFGRIPGLNLENWARPDSRSL